MRGIAKTVSAAALWLACALNGAAAQRAEAPPFDAAPKSKAGPRSPDGNWAAPFGGTFSANFTVASDYSYAGISNTQLGPAFQAGLDYRSDYIGDGKALWLYLGTWGSNVSFPASGPGVEIDVYGGFKLRVLDRKLKLDLGYLRYSFPGMPGEQGYDYGEFSLQADYDFGPAEKKWATLSGRVRYSPDSFGHSGASWTKRARLSAPLRFLTPGTDAILLELYGTLGNLWVERYLAYGLPSQDYWYWQTGLVISTPHLGFDITIAYTDTSISPEGCGNTGYCSGRVFVSVTKLF